MSPTSSFLGCLALLVTLSLTSCQLPSTDAPGPTLSQAELSLHIEQSLSVTQPIKPMVVASDLKYSTISHRDAFGAYQRSITFQTKETNDCDDLAFTSKAKIIEQQQTQGFNGLPAAFGIAWTPTRVFNVFIDQSQKLRVIGDQGFIGGPELLIDPVTLVVF
jgi:hypothetical protein